jgi:hypothetical protein
MRAKLLKRAVVCASITAVSVVGLGAGTASAGEWRGNGTEKGVNGNASECAYSGQNDGFHDPDYAEGPEDAATRVQNYGHIHKFLTQELGLPKGLPGYACNKSGKRG